MKRAAIFLFSYIILALPALCNSQYQFLLDNNFEDDYRHSLEDSGMSEKLGKVLFVIKTGLNLSNMNFNKGYHPNADYIEPTWKLGFLMGGAMQIPIQRRLYLIQEYILSRTRGQYTLSESIYNLDYLSLPLLLKYSFNNRFSIISGPQFELLISGKENTGGQWEDITKRTEERSVGWAVGLQYLVISKFILEARFMYGINAIGINQRSNINEFRFELFQISVNYVFN